MLPRKYLLCAAAAGALLVSTPALCGMLQENDKQEHFAVSAALGLAANEMVGDQQYGAMKAFGLAMLPGIAKEVYDSRSGGSGFSTRDLAADALGAAFGIGIGKGIRVMLQRHPDGGKGFSASLSSNFN